MSTTPSAGALAAIIDRLAAVHDAHDLRYPGDHGAHQPVHTVYGGAHLFRHDTAPRLGAMALRSLGTYAPDARTLAEAIGMSGDAAFAETIYARVVDKLRREPVEDFRIDFEDGYGTRPDEEEDACATGAAREVARGMREGTLPAAIGIRIKPLNRELAQRGLRTLDVFMSTLAAETGGALPPNLVVTLPKIVAREQVTALVDALATIEHATPIAEGALRMELMVETTQSIIGPDGSCPLTDFAEAARGRCVAAHFGVYDYTAGCMITAAHQRMSHPCCDFARHVMQVAFAGTGIRIADGATNILPIGPHPASADLDAAARRENRETVHHAWRLHADDVRRSLLHGYTQGWDLHPAQLPTRYAACYEFFLGGLDAATNRLRNFVDKAARATLAGDVFDDAATGQGLLNYFLQGIGCGAITEEEAVATGLTLDELRGRSFIRIVRARAGGGAGAPTGG